MYVSDVGIRVTDLERSVKFYTEILGLKVLRESENTPSGVESTC